MGGKEEKEEGQCRRRCRAASGRLRGGATRRRGASSYGNDTVPGEEEKEKRQCRRRSEQPQDDPVAPSQDAAEPAAMETTPSPTIQPRQRRKRKRSRSTP